MLEMIATIGTCDLIVRMAELLATGVVVVKVVHTGRTFAGNDPMKFPGGA